MENENEEQISQVADEENIEEITPAEEAEEVTLTVEDYRKLEAKNKELFARAKKAEEEAKIAKQTLNKPKEEQPKDDTNILEQVDIKMLKRDGFSDDDIANLRIIQAGEKAMGRNIDLFTASQNPLFVNNRMAQEAETKRMKAQLGASNGSGTVKEKEQAPEEFKATVKAESEALLKNMFS